MLNKFKCKKILGISYLLGGARGTFAYGTMKRKTCPSSSILSPVSNDDCSSTCYLFQGKIMSILHLA